MNKRNHKELWEQLKVLIIYSSKRRYSQGELYEIMSRLELGQLAQDPFIEILKASKEGGE